MTVIPQVPDPATGLPIGPLVDRAEPARPPEPRVLDGSYCRLEPLDPDHHGDDLFAASTPVDAARQFLYLPTDPPAARADFDRWLDQASHAPDQRFWVVIDRATGRVEGRQAFMRIDPPNQSIEIGNVYWGPDMARSRVSTEALFLFARHAFDELGYRRFEWKCNALNGPSCRAAERFGFKFEGIFRRAAILKGRSRDTAWYSMIDDEWPLIRSAFEAWLAPTNFDAAGTQLLRLDEVRAQLNQPS